MSHLHQPTLKFISVICALALPPLLTLAACGDDANTAGAGGGGGTGTQQGVGGSGGSLFSDGGPGSSTSSGMGGAGTGGMNTGGQGQVGFVWDHVYSGSGAAFSKDVALDNAGNLVVTGAFSGAFDFGGGVVTSSGGGTQTNVFVAKYSAAGNFMWARTFGSSDSASKAQSASAVAIDAQGNVAICGRFRGSLNFGGGVLTNSDLFANIFIAKLGPDGTSHIFSTAYTNLAGTTDECFDLAFDSTGALWATGWFQDEINFGGTKLQATGGNGDHDIYLAKFGLSGAHLASVGFGGPQPQLGVSMAIAPDNTVAVVGYTEGDVNFGNGNMPNAAGQRAFAARFNNTAQLIAGQIFTGDGVSTATAAAYDSAGNLYVGGNYKSSINLGGGNLTAKGGADDMFVARFGSDATLAYGVSLGGAGSEQLQSLAVDSQGYAVLVGHYNGPLVLNSSTTLTAAGAFDAFVIKLGPPGNTFSGYGFGDAAAQDATAVAIGTDDTMVVVGDFSGDVDLGSGSVGGGFDRDMFVAKFSE